MSDKNRLWVERYRPAGIADYVWINDAQRHQVEGWVQDRSIPNLMLSGGPGVGKTTLAKCLFHELAVDESDIRYVNGSHTNRVDDVRALSNFCETMPNGDFRYVLLDEADYLSQSAQAALRNMIEEYNVICRWILTCNYPHKIMPALHSRCQSFHIDHLDREQFVSRIATILLQEGVDLNTDNLEILDEYATIAYPDLRKCINMLQQNCADGQLRRPDRGSNNGGMEFMVQAVSLFKQGRIHDARKIICEQARPDDFEEIYRMLYRNLNWWGSSEAQQHQAIVIIANRLKDHAIAADPEINMAACLVELSSL
jgi:DNA polymerase III delta prime subunit